MRQSLTIGVMALFLTLGAGAGAETTFNAYYRIESEGKPVGIAVQKNEFDSRKNMRIIRYYSKVITKDGATHEEAVTSEQTNNSRPVGFDHFLKEYGFFEKCTGVVTGRTLEMRLRTKNGKTEKYQDVPPDVIMSAAFAEVLIANHPSRGMTFSFRGIDEETGRWSYGETTVLDEKALDKHKVYRVRVQFLNERQELWITDQAQVLATFDPASNVQSRLVASAEEALRGFQFNRSDLTKWFNEIPLGNKNSIASGEIKFAPELLRKR